MFYKYAVLLRLTVVLSHTAVKDYLKPELTSHIHQVNCYDFFFKFLIAKNYRKKNSI